LAPGRRIERAIFMLDFSRNKNAAVTRLDAEVTAVSV